MRVLRASAWKDPHANLKSKSSFCPSRCRTVYMSRSLASEEVMTRLSVLRVGTLSRLHLARHTITNEYML